MKKEYIKLDPKDNVIVLLKDKMAGEKINIQGENEISEIFLQNNIKAGHKVAIRDIAEGENIVKYGYPIGHATKKINIGEWVHTHNLQTNLEGKLDYSYIKDKLVKEKQRNGLKSQNEHESNYSNEFISHPSNDYGNVNKYSSPNNYSSNTDNYGSNAEIPVSTFMGYVREDGSVGTRNEIWIINTVGCVNKTAEILVKEANRIFSDKIGVSVDGVFAFPHPYGCSQFGDDHFTTQKILADLCMHPNAAGVLVLGLGCENNNINEFKKVLESSALLRSQNNRINNSNNNNNRRIKFLSTQDYEDEINCGLKLIGELIEYASGFKRQECPVSELKVGLKCGGSDAFSGITANPLCGKFSDLLLRNKGTTILTEVPEMFGAETILMERSENEEIFNKIVNMINGFKDYYSSYNQPIYENPSPGNKEGGITTLEEKSLGCILKGGSGVVTDVLNYGERLRKSGLNLLEGPGNDAVSITALTAAGANLIIFTTGRGTPFGGPVPTIKVSTNTQLYNRKKAWIDYDAGQLLEGKPMDEAARDFYNFVISVASGDIRTKNEINGYKEIAIFKNGITV
ncbi:MAG TPA: altronate dehydratase [Clostridiaceae bacterium]|nr:altronate dehydratase [Clostridiaceae bacterium]